MNVKELHALAERMIADGRGDDPVRIMWVVDGIPYTQPVIAQASLPHDGHLLIIQPVGKCYPPEWAR